MKTRIFCVDAFTDKPFGGNPAAVCLLSSPAKDDWMAALAREMNLSETAFLLKEGDGFSLRWFTPTVEVDLCGHATLASAHVLFEEGELEKNDEARFLTRSGLLTAKACAEGWIEMDFPAEPESPVEPPPGLMEALGIKPLYTGRNRFDFIVEAASEKEVRGLEPDFALLKKIGGRGVIVTAPSSSKKYDFVSRFFAPAAGIEEDPVTGSAHCCLGPYWEKRLGKNEFVAFQASKRGGAVRVRNRGERVALSGQAVTVWKGELED